MMVSTNSLTSSHFLDLRNIHVIGTSGWALNTVMPYGDLQIVGATGIPQGNSALSYCAARNRTGIAKAVISGDRFKCRNGNASVAEFKELKTTRTFKRHRQINVLVEGTHKIPVVIHSLFVSRRVRDLEESLFRPRPTIRAVRCDECPIKIFWIFRIRDPFHRKAGRVPANIMVSWNQDHAAPIAVEKPFAQSGQKAICDRVLILHGLLPVWSIDLGSLNEVAANDNRGGWRNSWGLTRVTITISKQRCKQAVVVYWVFPRSMKIRNVKNREHVLPILTVRKSSPQHLTGPQPGGGSDLCFGVSSRDRIAPNCPIRQPVRPIAALQRRVRFSARFAGFCTNRCHQRLAKRAERASYSVFVSNLDFRGTRLPKIGERALTGPCGRREKRPVIRKKKIAYRWIDFLRSTTTEKGDLLFLQPLGSATLQSLGRTSLDE